MSQRKEKADRDRPLSLLHQGSRDVVDCRNVICIDRVTKSETIGQYGGSDQNRLMREREEGPYPGRQIGKNQQAVNSDNPGPKTKQFGTGLVAKNGRFRMRNHGGPSIRKTLPTMSPQRKNRPMRAHRTPEG